MFHVELIYNSYKITITFFMFYIFIKGLFQTCKTMNFPFIF